MGEEISEQLDIIPARFFVRRHIRPKYSCRHCETVHTAPLPAQPIERGLAAPGLLAHVLASKYLDHLPLHRQEQMYAREGVALPSRATPVPPAVSSLEACTAPARQAMFCYRRPAAEGRHLIPFPLQ